MADRAPADGGLYTGVQRTLLAGMGLSFTLMGAGLLWQFVSPHPHPEQVVPLDQLAAQLLAGNPLALIDLGLLVLLSIPAAHLTVAAVAFARQGDRRYLGLTLLVLALLIAGALLAFLRT
jgi:uncharacterized membrane protein